ncbi:hypothetical protein EYF80_039778 [Liparis tanakae]|uniref:Uncharacterized protein n=1 Tax=Liparis tanakae TaxID=230148 RepID=A0A4Z2G915_9TELE|nr:hypothetical protein EYF80_039778 [Liparis tanakae]
MCGIARELTVEQLEDAVVLLLQLQVKVGAVAQHDALTPRRLQEAEDPEGQIQNQAHPGLDWARSEVHGHGLNDVDLRGGKSFRLRAGNHRNTSTHLHLAKVQRVAQVVSINHGDAHVAHCGHHAFHGHRGYSRVGAGPAEVSAPSSGLPRATGNTRQHVQNYSSRFEGRVDQSQAFFERFDAMVRSIHRGLQELQTGHGKVRVSISADRTVLNVQFILITRHRELWTHNDTGLHRRLNDFVSDGRSRQQVDVVRGTQQDVLENQESDFRSTHILWHSYRGMDDSNDKWTSLLHDG